jgi:glucokinase
MKKGLKMGVDMGGTAIKMAVLDERLRVLWSTVLDNRIQVPLNVLAKRLAGVLKGRLSGVKSVGFGVAGDIDSSKGLVRFSPNLGLKNAPLGNWLKKYLCRAVVIDNDANAAAWGIYKTQVSPKIKNVIVATLGTGVGGGLILDGKLYRGITGSAGEIGHIILVPGGRLCHCGNRGCLETYVGGTYLVREALVRIRRGEGSLIRRLAQGRAERVTPLLLNQAARRGDPMARSLWKEAGEKLGQGLAGLINVLNPELIVLCGGMASAQNLFLPAARKVISQAAFKTPARAVQIKVAAEASRIGVIGAALLAE